MIRNYILTLIVLTIAVNTSYAQIYEDKQPVSLRSGMDIFDEALATNVLPALNMEIVEKEDKDRDSTRLPLELPDLVLP